MKQEHYIPTRLHFDALLQIFTIKHFTISTLNISLHFSICAIECARFGFYLYGFTFFIFALDN